MLLLVGKQQSELPNEPKLVIEFSRLASLHNKLITVGELTSLEDDSVFRTTIND